MQTQSDDNSNTPTALFFGTDCSTQFNCCLIKTKEEKVEFVTRRNCQFLLILAPPFSDTRTCCFKDLLLELLLLETAASTRERRMDGDEMIYLYLTRRAQ